MKYRWEIINRIIESRGYKRYLEIGVKDGLCFNQVNCAVKGGMDIKPLFVKRWVYKMSSDAYFNSSMGRGKFDIIFIDGDHREEQVSRDIRNAALDEVLDPALVRARYHVTILKQAAEEKPE